MVAEGRRFLPTLPNCYQPPESMNPKKFFWRRASASGLAVFVAASLFLPGRLSAQSAVPAGDSGVEKKAGRAPQVEKSAAPQKESEEESIMLSPFEVNADKDNGFAATNAGTATKLGLDMKDMAAPYSVMTGEFLQALGITDLQTAVEWSTNGSPVIDGQGADQFMLPVMYNSRGITLNTGQQRNFFPTASATDTYNVERIDFGRGPNAVLFNSAANSVLGGGISTVGKRARLDRNFETLGFTFGSYNYLRATADVNQQLTSKLAMRINAVKHSKDGWLDAQMEKRKGLTVALLYRLTPKTDLIFEAFSDRLDRTNPTIPLLDRMSGWDGVTTFDGPITNAMLSSTATPGAPNYRGQTLTYNGEPQGISRSGTDYVYIPGSDSVMNWEYTARTRRGDETNRTPIYGYGRTWSRDGNSLLLPFGNASNQNVTPGIMDNGASNGPSILYSQNLPGDRFDRVIAGSKFTVPGKQFTNMPEEPLFTQFTRDVNFGLTHQFSDNLYFDMMADLNRVHNKAHNNINSFRDTYIDINKSLPDGTPNPYFLVPYSESQARLKQQVIDNHGVRTNIAYLKDLGRWGNYTFNLSGLYSTYFRETRQRVASVAQYSDPRGWLNQSINIRNYWTASEKTLIPEDLSQLGFFNRVADSTGNSYTTSSGSISPKWVLNAADDYKKTTKTLLLATSARYFRGRLVLSAGSRFDENRVHVRSLLRSGSWPVDSGWDGNTLNDGYWRPDAPNDWKTLTYTPLNSDGSAASKSPILATSRPTTAAVNGVNPVDPRYANYRFRDDYNAPDRKTNTRADTLGLASHFTSWLSAKLSYGANTMAREAATWDLSGDDARPETGLAYEGALVFSLFRDRLTVTPRYYFNRRENILGDFPGKTQINNLFNRNSWNDNTSSGRNQLGFAAVEEGDYYAYKNTGYEVEVIGRITRGWRISGTLGTTQGVTYDRWKNTQAYVQAHASEYKQVLEAAGGVIDANQKNPSSSSAPGLAVANPAITDAQITAAGGSTTERKGAVDDYNALWVQYDTIPKLADSVGLDRLTFKLLTDYTFQAGALKGLRVGIALNYTDNTLAGYRSADTIANPNFNASLPVSSSNLPYIDNPDVDLNTPVWVKNPIEVTGTFGYTRKINGGPRILRGKEVQFNLQIRNMMNWQRVVYQDTGLALRPVNGDFSQANRVSTPSRVARWQQPISFELSMTLRL